jgi:ribosomal-protein-alanine N-acetyltransferase
MTKIQGIFGDLPTLETERLILRKLKSDDAADIFAYASDPKVARYTTWQPHTSLENSKGLIDYVLGQYDRGEVAPWAMVHKRDDRMVGTVGFIDWHVRHARAETGYALARPYWNRGLTTEAMRAVVDFGFRAMHLNRIQGVCVVENIGSGRVMEKVGMTLEGVRREYEVGDTPSTYLDIAMYAILRREWEVDRAEDYPEKDVTD